MGLNMKISFALFAFFCGLLAVKANENATTLNASSSTETVTSSTVATTSPIVVTSTLASSETTEAVQFVVNATEEDAAGETIGHDPERFIKLNWQSMNLQMDNGTGFNSSRLDDAESTYLYDRHYGTFWNVILNSHPKTAEICKELYKDDQESDQYTEKFDKCCLAFEKELKTLIHTNQGYLSSAGHLTSYSLLVLSLVYAYFTACFV